MTHSNSIFSSCQFSGKLAKNETNRTFLHGVGLVEVDVVDDELDGAPELGGVAHDGERVEGVDEGERVVAQDVVDVDVVGVGDVGAAAAAVDRVELVLREGALHVAVVAELEHLARLGQHLEAQRLGEVAVARRESVEAVGKQMSNVKCSTLDGGIVAQFG